MLALPLVANILILTPLLIWMGSDRAAVIDAYGPDTDARRILMCLYGAILILSVALLVARFIDIPQARAWTQALLAMQIVYKLSTVAFVGLGNPVVSANLIIALSYAVVLALG